MHSLQAVPANQRARQRPGRRAGPTPCGFWELRAHKWPRRQQPGWRRPLTVPPHPGLRRPLRARYAPGRSCLTPEEKVVLGKGSARGEESELTKTKNQSCPAPLRLPLPCLIFALVSCAVRLPQRAPCSSSPTPSSGTVSPGSPGPTTLPGSRSLGKPGAEHPRAGKRPRRAPTSAHAQSREGGE